MDAQRHTVRLTYVPREAGICAILLMRTIFQDCAHDMICSAARSRDLRKCNHRISQHDQGLWRAKVLRS